MKVEPGAADLLEVAREALVAQVVPALPEAQRYAALMAANALAIAGRDLRAREAPSAELARIAALLAQAPPAAGDADALRDATARLAARIRAGGFDEGEARSRLLEHLRETTRERLAVSNPRALGPDGRKTP